jgi:hypothetical protein
VRLPTQEEEVYATLTACESDAALASVPAVRLALSVQVPRVTALKMELSRVTGSAGSALVRRAAAA